MSITVRAARPDQPPPGPLSHTSEMQPCWVGGTAIPQLLGHSGWEVRITTEAMEIKAGELGHELFWRSAKAQDKAGIQNDLSGSAAPASALQLLFAPFQAGEGGVWDPDPPGGWRPARGDIACLPSSWSPGAVGREADRVLNDFQVRFV